MLDTTHVSIHFDAQQVAEAICVAPDAPPAQVLAALHLPPTHGVIVIHGGAGGMEATLIDQVRRFLIASVAPFAEQHRILVLDGGTRAGVTQAMGEARANIGGTFPLVGVCPRRFAAFPGGPALNQDRYPLEPSHSHFVLVEGDQFGVESDLLVGMLQATEQPGLALIINGGTVVAEEISAHAQIGNTLVTVRGSGRAADELADPNSERRAALPPDAHIEIANLQAPGIFRRLLGRLLLA